MHPNMHFMSLSLAQMITQMFSGVCLLIIHEASRARVIFSLSLSLFFFPQFNIHGIIGLPGLELLIFFYEYIS